MSEIKKLNTDIDIIQKELSNKNLKLNNELIDYIQKNNGEHKNSLLKKTKSILKQFNEKLTFNEKTLESQLSNLIE